MRLTIPASSAAPSAFWLVAGSLVVLKLLLVSDLALIVNFSPHDDTLYVERAFQLLAGNGFGPYDSRTLVKYPGLSLWLAGSRWLGIPYVLSVAIVYVAAGAYLCAALLRCGARRPVVLLAFSIYLFNPLTFGVEWHRVIREPLGTGLLVAMIAAMMHVSAAAALGQRVVVHLVFFSLCFAFSLYLREDDRLLWAMLVMFVASLAIVLREPFRSARSTAIALVISAFLLPATMAWTYKSLLHDFAERHYGLPLIHEFSEGEYPRLLAAIRSINTAKDNRMVMVTQESLGLLRREVPLFAPVVARLPPPGPGTVSCRLHGVCSEWSNGWMPFWIRDEAWRAGLTPTLATAQAYYRAVRIEIERACDSGRLHCTLRGDGLVPPMELRWTRAYLSEAWRLAGMALRPVANVIEHGQVRYDVPLDTGRLVQLVTMTSRFDTLMQADFSANGPVVDYVNPRAHMRSAIAGPWQVMAILLILSSLVALLVWMVRLSRAEASWPGPLVLVALIFGLYSLLRFAILSYVAVFMGAFDPRMMFSTYTAGTFLALPFLYDTVFAKKRDV